MTEIITDLLEQDDTQKDKYLTFLLGNEKYGIEIRHVTEIIGILPITEVPDLPEYIKGIINLRGKIIPVMDVRLRFGKPDINYNERTCIIVIDIIDFSVGLVVDSVSDVLSISEQDIVPPPELNKGQHNRYIKGIGKISEEVMLILDCEKLLTENLASELNELI